MSYVHLKMLGIYYFKSFKLFSYIICFKTLLILMLTRIDLAYLNIVRRGYGSRTDAIFTVLMTNHAVKLLLRDFPIFAEHYQKMR